MSSPDADDGQHISHQQYNILIVCNWFSGRYEHHGESETRGWTRWSKWVKKKYYSFIRIFLFESKVLQFIVCVRMWKIRAKNGKNRIFCGAMSWSWIFILISISTFVIHAIFFPLCRWCESGMILYSCWRLPNKRTHVCCTIVNMPSMAQTISDAISLSNARFTWGMFLSPFIHYSNQQSPRHSIKDVIWTIRLFWSKLQNQSITKLRTSLYSHSNVNAFDWNQWTINIEHRWERMENLVVHKNLIEMTILLITYLRQIFITVSSFSVYFLSGLASILNLKLASILKFIRFKICKSKGIEKSNKSRQTWICIKIYRYSNGVSYFALYQQYLKRRSRRLSIFIWHNLE